MDSSNKILNNVICISLWTNALGKSITSSLPHSSYRQTVGKTELSSFDRATDLEEVKF